MRRPLLYLILVALLALSAALGNVVPAGATAIPDPPTGPQAIVVPYGSGINEGSGPKAQDTPTSSGGGEKWIEVILSKRLLVAHQGDQAYLQTTVSIGKPSTPTVRGTFRIYSKLRSTRMVGPGYNLPNVPNTMYFYRGYAIHGAYWVKTFGTMVSHGCVNVNLTDAKTLFDWTPIGTRVVIH
jgi:lipoprotein-anchoring transpeptidase ErfK/SrfK